VPVSVSIVETVGLRWCSLRTQFYDLLFPPRCIGCGRVGTLLCIECLDQLPRVDSSCCPRCGDAVVVEGLCARCRTSPLHIERIRSVMVFEGVLREAVHQLKYRGRTALAVPLGGLMAAYWTRHSMPRHLMPPGVLVPVPLHAARQRARGYNQAALLAREMGRQVGLPVDEQTLIRQRTTVPQVDLNARERRENVRDAFCCSGNGLVGKRVLLIDDVCTTGATLEACAIALTEGGVRSVQALTLARAR